MSCFGFRFSGFFLLLFGTILTISFPLDTQAQNDRVAGQFLVKFSKDAPKTMQRSMRSAMGVYSLRSNQQSRTELVQTFAADGAYDENIAKELLAAGIVEYIEPNYIVSISSTPNDSNFASQWGLHNTGQTGGTNDVDVDAPEAWDITTGSSSVVVGVVDTGVNYDHPDLAANIWVNTGEIADNGIDDDGNGVVDDVNGFNAISNSGDPMDDNGHGSHVSGILGAVGNNGSGVSGVNWNVKIMGLKFLNASGSGTTQGAIDAIEYAVAMKNRGVNLKVLNNSWGGGSSSQALEDAISAANNAGILFVAAAGNSGNNTDNSANYPSNYDVANVVSVAAIDHNGNLASFSNYGRSTVDLAAPGVTILSTSLGSQYVNLDGTSMATPFVAGVAAMVASRNTSFSASELKARLLNTVKPLSSLNGLMVSPGIVSAHRALTNELAPTPTPIEEVSYTKASTSINFNTELGTKVLDQDDGYTTKDLGFTFSYYGEDFTRIAISANGRVIPLTEDDSAPTSSDFSNRLTPGISPYNDDHYPSPSADGGVWFSSNSSTATITWVVVNYAHRNSSDAQAEIKFQVKLFSNGNIEFHYLDTFTGDNSFDYAASATVGIAAPSGVSGEALSVTHNETLESEVGNNKALVFTSSNSGEAKGSAADFDGDGKSDIVVFRPSTGFWFVLTSSSGFDASQMLIYQLGLAGDKPLTGDFDGDGQADMAVWRPSTGTWYFLQSSTSYGTITAIQWGANGDTPLTGDYDGDGSSDLVVYRVSTGSFHVLVSSSGFNRDAALLGNSAANITVALGGYANDPVVGDFTGNGKDDFATVWQLVRFWTFKDSNNVMLSSLPWGEPGDTPLACDWDGDSIQDRIIVRVKSNNLFEWYAASATGPVYTETFGSLGDLPNCNRDYDGDGQADLRVFRNSTGQWFIRNSVTNEMGTYSFGLPGDIPL